LLGFGEIALILWSNALCSVLALPSQLSWTHLSVVTRSPWKSSRSLTQYQVHDDHYNHDGARSSKNGHIYDVLSHWTILHH
jgi:hypothetical protein